MTELKPIVQGISSASFLGIGIYFLISRRLKSTNIFEDKIIKIASGFLIVLGISTGILMVILQQPRAWQAGINLLYVAAIISSFFSGIYNLYYRQRKNADHNDAKVARIIGFLLILIGVWIAILYFLSVY